MAVMLFSLKNVPDDEAEEVRALLEENEIEFYETSAGNWGISSAAIWLRNETRLAEARALIDAYQQRRFETQRALYEQLKSEGKHRRLWDVINENPLRVVFYLAVVLVILYLSIRPFLM
jgi:hypothetical protein